MLYFSVQLLNSGEKRRACGVTRGASGIRRCLQQQSQVGSFEPFSAAMNWAAAQPNPASTVIASTGQLRAHAPHSIHAVGLTSLAT